MIRRVLIANRGEIAVRVIRACREQGLETVVPFSEADRDALPCRLADRAVCIGPSSPGASYLNITALLSAARATGADAVHPGYGFLAENAGFADACAEHGLRFIGPSPDAIRIMGDKVAARQAASRAGVPVLPGTLDPIDGAAAVAKVAADIGYPLLLKAAAGGGGRGMRLVAGPAVLADAVEQAAAEAQAAFGNGALYVERYIQNARHVEVQILGDGPGHVIHLGERDCSLQRRHQKLLEEAPCPVISTATRRQLWEAAVTLGRHLKYSGAGTVEFLLDLDSERIYFIEMNTRVQVEHPVTEMVTGIDIVGEQLRVAAGEPLAVRQADVRLAGHALECRINAEDPDRGFMPTPGKLTAFIPPGGPGVRVDTHCYTGYTVPPFYDSLLAKVVVHADDRDGAIRRMAAALDSLVLEGIPSTIPAHRRILADPDFRAGRFNTRWVEHAFH